MDKPDTPNALSPAEEMPAAAAAETPDDNFFADRPAAPPPQPKKQDGSKKRGRNLVFLCLLIACVLVLSYALSQLISIQANYQKGIDEYDRLAELYSPAAAVPDVSDSAASTPTDPAEDASQPPALSPYEINPDYAGWIEIPGTAVNYPVVRGPDNTQYLKTTFEGAYNDAGTPFMDYRNNADFHSHHTVIYGHNLKNGRMFGALHSYLDPDFLAANPTITVTTHAGDTITYRIFAARVTDMYDDGYRIDFADDADISAFIASYGGPAGSTQLLTLSTCTNGPTEERLLVLATPE